jgi:diguanylate cyclase (GGDEF)-like protein
VVMLPTTDIDGAERTAETIRATIVARRIPHAASARGLVSISIGVACGIPMSGRGPEALIAAADTALYAAKRQGRNRVLVAGHLEVQPAAAD